MTATGDNTLEARRELLLQAYAAHSSQDVDILLELVSADVDWAQRQRKEAPRQR